MEITDIDKQQLEGIRRGYLPHTTPEVRFLLSYIDKMTWGKQGIEKEAFGLFLDKQKLTEELQKSSEALKNTELALKKAIADLQRKFVLERTKKVKKK